MNIKEKQFSSKLKLEMLTCLYDSANKAQILKTLIFLSSAHFGQFELVLFQTVKFHLLQNIKLPATFSEHFFIY